MKREYPKNAKIYFSLIIYILIILIMPGVKYTETLNKIIAIATIIVSLFLVKKTKNNAPLFIISLFIFYSNYSICVGVYLSPSLRPQSLYPQIQNINVYGIGILLMFLFTLCLTLLLPDYSNNKDEIKISKLFVKEENYNSIIFFLLTLIYIYILINGYTRVEGGRGSSSPLYEYNTIILILMFYYTGNRKKTKIISCFCASAYILTSIINGTRVEAYYTYMLAYFIDPTWLFVGVEDMKWALIKNVLTKIIALIGIFTFVRTENDVQKYVLIQGSSFLIANALSFTQLKRYVGAPSISFISLKKDLVNSALLFLPSVGTTIYTQCDKIMIELMTSATDEVSYYDYSEKIVTIPLAFITAMSTVMMPRIANEFKKGNSDQIHLLLNKAASISLLLAFPMTLGLIGISDKLIPWYLGGEFEPTSIAIKIIAPIVVANTMIGVSGTQYFTATNQIKVLTISQFSAAGANIILNAILIPKCGFIGAAIATLITSFACAAIQYYYMLKQVKMPKLIITGIRYLILSIIMYLSITLSTQFLSNHPITTMIQIIIGGVVYGGALLIIRDSQFKEVMSMVTKKFAKK